MLLKAYQAKTLDSLRDYFKRARESGPKAAYDAMIAEPERQKMLGRWASAYRPIEALPDTPYVCVRVPTGGGKTLLAAHTIGLARQDWIAREYPFVLWLTPSDAIRQQTADALKDRRHFYRQGLDAAFGGHVRVFDIEDFELIRPHDLRDNCCIVVGTVQTLRVTNTSGRRIYAHNENFEPHFAGVPKDAPGLERHGNAGVKFSFANLMHMLRPLLIIDEAHNNTTRLSYEAYERVNPCAVVEFTATPRLNSNLLHSVTGWELKEAQMIKLPIKLAEHSGDWRAAVSGACVERARLAEKAAQDKDFIRPIVLFQAQSRDGEINADALRKHLLESEEIAPEKVVVATGDERGLEGVNLFDPACPVEYVITVQALKEGWDCSFAYVLCSVASANSETAVEQLLGRVLRMPYVTRREDADLNKAYAHMSEPNFAAAAKAVTAGLVRMGFDESEAAEQIESDQYELGDDDLFGPKANPPPALICPVPKASLPALRAIASDKITLNVSEEGASLRVEGYLSPALGAQIEAALPEAARAGFRETQAAYVAQEHPRLPPAQRGMSFVAPALMAQVQGEFVFANDEVFMEAFAWSPAKCDANLGAAHYSPRETIKRFEVDLAAKGAVFTWVSEEDSFVIDAPIPEFGQANFANWLEKRLRDNQLSPRDVRDFVLRALNHLVSARDLSMNALWFDRHKLASALQERLASSRRDAHKAAHQMYLFEPQAQVTTSLEAGFRFHERAFEGVRFQRAGQMRFGKHFLGPDRVPAFDGKADGEEMQCAFALDSLDAVEFWLRNVPQHADAFSLPLAKGRFYPDFIAKLKDGRVFVVEYKGGDRVDLPDSDNKRNIGDVWEKAGGGLFLMVEKMKHGLDMRAQLKAKLEG